MVVVNRQRGIALLSVLLIFAVVSVLTLRMLDRQYLNIKRTQYFLDQDQASVYGVSGEALAIRALYEDYKKDEQNTHVDGLQDDWAHPVTFALEGGGIQAKLIDAQSLFNLNNIAQDYHGARAAFKQLILSIDPQADADLIVDSIVQWMDEDVTPQGVGAEDSYYQSLTPGYRTANRLFAQASELRLIRGMTEELYQKILPYVIALPAQTFININTAEPLLVQSYTGAKDITSLVQEREKAAFISVDAAWHNGSPPANMAAFSVASEYFLLRSEVALGDQNIFLQSLIYRPSHLDAKENIRVIQRNKGVRW